MFFFQTLKKQIDDLPEVLVESAALLPDLLCESRAPSMCSKYRNVFLRWTKWAQYNGLGSREVLPAKPLPFALYLASIIQTASSPSPVLTAYSSVKFYHDLYGCLSPMESSLVVNVLEAAKRKLAKSLSKKEPVTIDLLQSIYSHLFVDSNIYNQRIICAMLIDFAGFLRSSELLQIRLCDVKFESTYVKIFLEHSKTDQYRDGAWIVISRTGTNL